MQSQDHLNAVTSVFHSILTIIAVHAGNLARETSPVSLSSLHAIFVQVSLRNSKSKLSKRRYSRKQKASNPCNSSKEDDLDLLGDDVEAFSGSEADLESAAENLFSSPPRPQPLRFESLSLKTPQTVPPTPGTALQNKIESRLEKSLGAHFNIQLQQQMGVFQASMQEAMKSLQDEMHSMKKASKSDVVQTSDSLPKAGPSKQPDPIPTLNSISTTWASDHSDAQPMDTEHYGPPLPPQSTQSVQSEHASRHSDVESDHSDHHSESEQPKRVCSKAKKHSDKRKYKVQAKYYSQSSSSEEDESSAPIKSLQNLNKRLLPSLNIRIAQIQSSTGR